MFPNKLQNAQVHLLIYNVSFLTLDFGDPKGFGFYKKLAKGDFGCT